jgi:hypothetical protein
MEKLNGKPISELPLCGVFAVAHIADKPVGYVFELCKKLFHKPNNWRGRLSMKKCLALLDALGVPYSHVDRNPWERGRPGRKCTLTKWANWFAARGRTYLVETGSHFQIVCDGCVRDQRGVRPIEDFKGKRSLVQRAVLV